MTSSITRPDSEVNISYDLVGNGSPLLFLHGLGAGRAQTTSALTDLPQHQIIAPDMLGHGDSISENSEAIQSFDQFADDSIAILDHLGIEKANIGGLSMGSGISINIALRYPERVNKLILLRPSWLCEKQPGHLALVASVGQWIHEHGAEKAQQLLQKHPDYLALHKEVPKVAASILGLFTRPQHYSHTAVLYKMWMDAPFSDLEELTKISNKTLVLHTTRDELHPIPVAETIANQLANSTVMSLPPRYDDPENYGSQLNKVIAEFLSD